MSSSALVVVAIVIFLEEGSSVHDQARELGKQGWKGGINHKSS
jgi:hypothetical protein